MSAHQDSSGRRQLASLDSRLAAYLAAAGTGAALSTSASTADAAVVANTTVQPFGINSEVNIDFNTDGQTDLQVDHDRVNLNGTNLDYLQIDKNDVNSEVNPFPTDYTIGFPANGTTPNDTAQAAYLIEGPSGSYPAALMAGSPIGPGQTLEFQEGDDFNSTMDVIRANRLIDEDQTQLDQALNGKTADQVYLPTNGPNFVGLGGEVRYLGVKLDLNDTAQMTGDPFSYGWIGIRIDNEADATGAVVGYGYETTPGVAILAGDTGPFTPNADYDDDGDVDGQDFLLWQREVGATVANGTGADGDGNGMVDGQDLALWRSDFGAPGVALAHPAAGAVPEPGSLLMAALGGALLAVCLLWKYGLGKLVPVRSRR